MIAAGTKYLRVVGPVYGLFGIGMAFYFASQGAGKLRWPLTAAVTLAAAPVNIAVNAAGTYLYVVSGTTSGTLTEYALSSGTIGSATATIPLVVPGYTTDTILPSGVAVLPSNASGADTGRTSGIFWRVRNAVRPSSVNSAMLNCSAFWRR